MSQVVGGGRNSDLTDEELLRRARTGSEGTASREAAAELLGRYRKRVYIWCFRYVSNHETAMDLAQEVLLKAYRSLDSLRQEACFSSWLYAMTRNRCFNELRRPAIFSDTPIDFDDCCADSLDAAERLIQELDEERILALIHCHLDEEEQSVLWLRCFERMPIDAITAVLKIESASGARGVLQRARRKLRAALMRESEGGEVPS